MMKKFKSIILIITVALISFSCDDDGGTSILTLEDGIVPNMQKDASTDAFLDLVKISAGENVSVSFSVAIAQGKAASTDIVGFYRTASGALYTAVLNSNPTLPTNLTLSANDVIASFSELNSTDDLELGDVLIITTSSTRSDGTVLNVLNADGTDNLSANIKGSGLFTTVINYPVSCPSDIGGTYNVLSSGFSTDPGPTNNPIVDFPYTVTVTDNGGGSYTISDGVAGIYIEWYTIYGYSFETAGNFTDVCGTLTGSWIDGFSCQIDLTGTVNDDGTLTIQWINCFGDEITEAIYTPQ